MRATPQTAVNDAYIDQLLIRKRYPPHELASVVTSGRGDASEKLSNIDTRPPMNSEEFGSSRVSACDITEHIISAVEGASSGIELGELGIKFATIGNGSSWSGTTITVTTAVMSGICVIMQYEPT